MKSEEEKSEEEIKMIIELESYYLFNYLFKVIKGRGSKK